MITGLVADSDCSFVLSRSPSPSQDGGLLISRRLVVRHRGITFNTSPNSPVFESEAHCDSLDYLSVLAERQMRHRFSHYCFMAQRCHDPSAQPLPLEVRLGHDHTRPSKSSIFVLCELDVRKTHVLAAKRDQVVDSRIRVIK